MQDIWHGNPPYEDDEGSLLTARSDLRALIVGAVDDPYQSVVEKLLGCRGHGLWVHCEGGWIWDPYGSLVRSVLMTVHRHRAVQNIFVVTQLCSKNSTVPSPRSSLGTENPPSVVRTVQYLLQHVYHVDPAQWFDSSIDQETAVAHSVQLLRGHPLMPETTVVQGFLLNEDASQLTHVEA